ncbi:MAG: NAD+ synthase [Chloroflexota bacterium]|nr:NAD+ synthase [Chloroflexota bacterium]
MLPALDAARAVDVIVRFIRAQLEQTGFRRLVVGLSGGIDSATVAFLCARAVAPDELLSIRMPYRSSSDASEADALRVVEAIGCRTERVDITPMVDPMLALIDAPDAPVAADPLNVRRGNVMARQRMIVLYDRSAAFDALVAGTSNKTEALLGYGTVHGDMAAAFHPIGDLYKSQLREVATCLGVPPAILEKAPSADLWPGQTDEQELGASYVELDTILYQLVDRRWRPERVVAAGFDAALVDRVAQRVARFEFKRQQPPVAKLSLRTPGIDHLYPRRRPGSRRS